MIIGYKRSSKYFASISCLIYIQIIWSILIGLLVFEEKLNFIALIGSFFIIMSGILSIPGQYRQVKQSNKIL